MVRRGDERSHNGCERLRIEAVKPPILYQIRESIGDNESGTPDGSAGGFMVTCDKPESEPARLARWKTMTTQNDPERQIRIAFKQLAEQTSESHALDVLDDIQHEALDPASDVVAPEAETATDGGQQQAAFSGVLDDPSDDAPGAVELLGIEGDDAVLGGDTYDVKDWAIKSTVSYQDRDWHDDGIDGYPGKPWTVPVDDLDALKGRLNDRDYLLVDAREDDAGEDEEPEVPVAEVLDDFVDLVDEGDRIRVTYAQKNGNGYNEKEGTVREVQLPDDEYVDATQLVFVRDDDQTMYVDVDYEYDDTLRLRTSMSHAPFVGDVVWLEVLR